MVPNVRALLMTALLVVGVVPSIGCGDIVVPVDLALEQPSSITLELPIFPPPYNEETTSLVGGVQTTIVIDLSFLDILGALAGKAVVADVGVDDVLIAGTEILIGGGLPTGTICLFQDPNLPSEGTAAFNILLGQAAFDMALNTNLAVTDPLLASLLGPPAPFTQVVSAIVPVSLTDLFAIISGSGGGLTLTQEIDATFGPVPIIGTIHVTGELTLASTDTLPSDPLLDECAAFIASLP